MPNRAVAQTVVTRRVPATQAGFVRYEMEDASGVVGACELREDHAHDDLELYLRAFLRRYPPRDRRAFLRVLP